MTQNVVSAINRATGTVTRERRGRAESQDVLACPIWVGGKDWESVYGSAAMPEDPVFVGCTGEQNTSEDGRNRLPPPETAGSPAGSRGVNPELRQISCSVYDVANE